MINDFKKMPFLVKKKINLHYKSQYQEYLELWDSFI